MIPNGTTHLSPLEPPPQYFPCYLHSLGPADNNDLVLYGPTQRFKDGVSKLGQLVQEEDASVANGNLSRPGQPSVRFNM